MMMDSQLPILPVVLPLATGAVLLLLDVRRTTLKAVIGFASIAAQLVVALGLTQLADAATPTVYALGNWHAPFGIVLVVDRLATVMVLLTTLVGTAAHCYSLARSHGPGRFPVGPRTTARRSAGHRGPAGRVADGRSSGRVFPAVWPEPGD